MRIAAIVLIASLISQSAMAECHWAVDIEKSTDGHYVYTKECHEEVGQKLQDLKDREKQVDKLNKAVELKDLALDKADERIDKLHDSNKKLEDRIDTVEKMNDTNKVLYFLGGVALTVLSAFAIGAASK